VPGLYDSGIKLSAPLSENFYVNLLFI